jgi:HK97 family phage prohead protease
MGYQSPIPTGRANISDGAVANERVFDYTSVRRLGFCPEICPGFASVHTVVSKKANLMIELRTATTPVSMRIADTDQRTVVGIVAPFNEMNEIAGWEGDFIETILPGAFARTIRERGPQGAGKIKLLEQHDRRQFPLGTATVLDERRGGLYAEFRVASTAAGDEALTLIREGIIDGFSIGFTAIDESWTKKNVKTGLKVRELVTVKLHEISLVTYPALAGASVTGTRNLSRSYRDRLNLLRK